MQDWHSDISAMARTASIPQPFVASRFHTCHPKRRELMLATYNQMEKTAERYARLGYKYIIGWRDVRGYGLMILQFAEWQTPSSAPHINLRLS